MPCVNCTSILWHSCLSSTCSAVQQVLSTYSAEGHIDIVTLWCIIYISQLLKSRKFRNLCQSRSRSKKRMHCYKFGHGLCNSVQSPFTANTLLSVRVKLLNCSCSWKRLSKPFCQFSHSKRCFDALTRERLYLKVDDPSVAKSLSQNEMRLALLLSGSQKKESRTWLSPISNPSQPCRQSDQPALSPSWCRQRPSWYQECTSLGSTSTQTSACLTTRWQRSC